MTDIAISAENLSKSYLVGHNAAQTERYTALRDVLSRNARNLARKTRDMFSGRAIVQGDEVEEFWALKDVSFEIKRGDRVGIIGRNGAGKSTLLKILSRITEPTTGRIKIAGRVASLLEVGTGFHPELTGRENIYLNGAILGMSRKEIHKRFEEIVDFAEVEKFLDTPVKRYSSGMYVRLAFAVAAHLEPEILIVDEVLAVGDAEFQKKCIGKMENAGKDGRTVLFVSHNMQAIQSLCGRCILVKNGRIQEDTKTAEAISKYLNSGELINSNKWAAKKGLGSNAVRLNSLTAKSSSASYLSDTFPSDSNVIVEMNITLDRPLSGLCVGFDLFDSKGGIVMRSYNTDVNPLKMPSLQFGNNTLRCEIPGGLLNAGGYQLAPRISIHNQEWILNCDPLIAFKILLNHGVSPYWNVLTETNRPGNISPILKWNISSQVSEI